MNKRRKRKRSEDENESIDLPIGVDIDVPEVGEETEKVEKRGSVEETDSEVGFAGRDIGIDVDDLLKFHAEVADKIRTMLREKNIIDLETLTCLDEDACREVFTGVVKLAKERSLTYTTVLFVLQRERALNRYSWMLIHQHLLSPFEKEKLAGQMCLDALITFQTAIENRIFISRLESQAVLFAKHADTTEEAVASLICMLFKRPEDTPDTWLLRVEKIHKIIIECATSSLAQREYPEIVEV